MNSTPWYLQDEFWQVFYDCMFHPDSFEQAKAQVSDILSLASCGTDQPSVLDLACGPGRHAIPMAELGCAVTALDASPYLLNIAKSQAKKHKLNITWRRQDMRAAFGESTFDLITCLWSSFGYFEQASDDLKVLNLAFKALKPGAVLILDIVGKESILRDLQPVHCTEFDKDVLLFERPALLAEMTRLSNQWTLVKAGQAYQVEWEHSIYSAAEMKLLCEKAGFEQIDVFADWSGNDYDDMADRLIIRAQK